jgi:3-oxoacyl-(acyl-carrier-protein) synthase
MGSAAESHASYLGLGTHRRRTLSIFTESLPHAPTGHLTTALGATGPSMSISSNCCTGVDAIQLGRIQVSSGAADVAITVASEAPIFPDIVDAFASLGLLSRRNHAPPKASRPYDRLRDGLVLGEGGGALVLEHLASAIARGAPIYAEIIGYAAATDPTTIRSVDTTSPVLAAVITEALQRAGLSASAVDSSLTNSSKAGARFPTG